MNYISKKPKWHIYFVRHWETYNNELKIVNWWNDDNELNNKWIISSKELWKKLKKLDFKFEIILSSPLKRCLDTAYYILQEIWYNIDTEFYDFLKEQSYWEYKWLESDFICKKFNVIKSSLIYRNNSEEPLDVFYKRVIKWYDDVLKKHKWKNILIISHGWVFRVLNSFINNIDISKAFFEEESISNTSFIKL